MHQRRSAAVSLRPAHHPAAASCCAVGPPEPPTSSGSPETGDGQRKACACCGLHSVSDMGRCSGRLGSLCEVAAVLCSPAGCAQVCLCVASPAYSTSSAPPACMACFDTMSMPKLVPVSLHLQQPCPRHTGHHTPLSPLGAWQGKPGRTPSGFRVEGCSAHALPLVVRLRNPR